MWNVVKIFLCGTLLCLISFTSSGQNYVSGHITDTENNSPISDVHVFIAGTTAGTTTDAEGCYRLDMPGSGSYRLVVSHAGYEPVFVDIEPGQASKKLDITLHERELEEVTVSVKVKARKEDVNLFWKVILGKNPSPKTIHAINPKAVYFYYNSETKKLTVTCRVPLQIVNNETGYNISYVLKHFTHDYKTSLTSWEGVCVFEELEQKNFKQKNTWEKNRKKVYDVSINKFIRSLYDNSLMKDGFLLAYAKGFEPDHPLALRPISMSNPKNLLSSGSSDGTKTLNMPSDSTIILVCYDKPVTNMDLKRLQFAQNGRVSWTSVGMFRNKLLTPDDPVHIFADGTFRNQLRLSTFANSYPLTGLNMTLPIEYGSGMKPWVTDVVIAGENEFAKTDEGIGNQPLAANLDSLAKRFDMQLSVFPQEKVYLHTDKPYYVSGERIWFRAFVVDAASHTPTSMVNCVYAELFDVRDSVVSRAKTGFNNGAFSGYIPIPEDIPEGNYTLRAYTDQMRNLDEDYFFMKNIRIGNHQSRMIQALPEFEFMPDNKIGTDIRFSPISPTSPISPESIKISINSGKPMNVKYTNGAVGLNFTLPSLEKQRVMLLDAMYNQHPYRQYIRIPLPDDDFDVSFYPEGGSALHGSMGRIAFKATQRDGTEIDVSGVVYDQTGNEITQFKTDFRGMGQFGMAPVKDSYYAVCTNRKGQTKRFELPVVRNDGYALSARWIRDRLIVNVHQPETRKIGDTLCLIIHTRGVLQDVFIWENIREPVTIHQDFFPSGVSNLLLLTKDIIPVSERLVFVYKDDQANIACMTDRDTYSSRSPVEFSVHITDETGEPLKGNFSISVTDNREVAVDTTSNIFTSLLLTSDLRGHIPDPAFYFQKNTQSAWALDLLMLTQGWRRYDTERIVRNDFMHPDTLMGKDFKISGTVTSMSGKKPVANVSVSILSLKGDYFAETITGQDGRFYFRDGDVADSTWFMVQGTGQSGRERVELILDQTSYPNRNIPVVAYQTPEYDVFAKYANKVEQQYMDEHGVRVIPLSEIAITAKKKPVQRSSYYHTADYSMNTDEQKILPSSMNALLLRLPGVNVSNDSVYIARFGGKVSFMIDDFPANDISGLDPMDILQIDLLTSRPSLSFFGKRGDKGVIAIYTRSGSVDVQNIAKKSDYTKSIMPLGFQKPVEFYAPKYDTPTLNTKPDLRTTIHWQPNITTDEEGKASFSFYTADTPSTYTVVIEGVTEDGKIVYKRDKIVVDGK